MTALLRLRASRLQQPPAFFGAMPLGGRPIYSWLAGRFLPGPRDKNASGPSYFLPNAKDAYGVAFCPTTTSVITLSTNLSVTNAGLYLNGFSVLVALVPTAYGTTGSNTAGFVSNEPAISFILTSSSTTITAAWGGTGNLVYSGPAVPLGSLLTVIHTKDVSGNASLWVNGFLQVSNSSQTTVVATARAAYVVSAASSATVNFHMFHTEGQVWSPTQCALYSQIPWMVYGSASRLLVPSDNFLGQASL